MKAAIALIFFACVAGSMASDVRGQIFGQLVQQGQAAAQSILGELHKQILGLVQSTVGQLSALVGSIGGRFDFNSIVDQFKPHLQGLLSQVLTQVLGGLSGLIGGRASIDVAAILKDFLEQLKAPVVGLGQHFLNQGLAAVLGGLGSLGGSRGISDLFTSLQQQISAATSVASAALSGVLGNLSALGSNLLDATKPHWTNLQEQLVGHGLNVLGSISESISNVHGAITGGN